MDCIFCRILKGEEPSWKIFEDEHHTAFLTPFPNTPGFSVLITKEHLESNVLHCDETRYLEMMKSARALAHLLDQKLKVKRTALVIEGMGVNHAHVKLIPMHGIPDGPWQPMRSSDPTFNNEYRGFLSTQDGPRMSDTELDAVRDKIVS